MNLGLKKPIQTSAWPCISNFMVLGFTFGRWGLTEWGPCCGDAPRELIMALLIAGSLWGRCGGTNPASALEVVLQERGCSRLQTSAAGSPLLPCLPEQVKQPLEKEIRGFLVPCLFITHSSDGH